jgi:hypothetical protein
MTDLERVAAFGQSRGWYVRRHTLLRAPEHWTNLCQRYGVYGRSDYLRDRGTVIPRAEVAALPGTPDALAALVLLHELGHCEHAETTHGRSDYWYKKDPEHRFEQEADAWARALVWADELGITVTPDVAEFALAALLSYAGRRTSPTADALYEACN